VAYPVVASLLGLTLVAIFFAVHLQLYWIAVPLVLVASHLMHGSVIGFHEASHGLLRKNRLLNELDGIVIGVFSLTSFSLYRAAHQTHHAHLGTERDEEFWPFVRTGKPRWFRILAAFLELGFGLFYTPALFIRTFFRKGSPIRSPKVRRRVWLELALMATVWAGVLALVALRGAWEFFLWMYLMPAWIAGNLQSWRKYIEHMGLRGSTVKSATRSIVANTWWGRLVSFTLLHEPYHGVHHQHAGLPHAELPAHAAELQPAHTGELPPFRSYGHAFRHLLGCLADPRVGTQWCAAPPCASLQVIEDSNRIRP
jgi:fatty acid desaturase